MRLSGRQPQHHGHPGQEGVTSKSPGLLPATPGVLPTPNLLTDGGLTPNLARYVPLRAIGMVERLPPIKVLTMIYIIILLTLSFLILKDKRHLLKLSLIHI